MRVGERFAPVYKHQTQLRNCANGEAVFSSVLWTFRVDHQGG